jgi:hypothetical protein
MKEMKEKTILFWAFLPPIILLLSTLRFPIEEDEIITIIIAIRASSRLLPVKEEEEE